MIVIDEDKPIPLTRDEIKQVLRSQGYPVDKETYLDEIIKIVRHLERHYGIRL